VKTEAGKFETRTITVNIRNSKLAGGGQVKLKDREIKGPVSSPVLHWDDKLTLEFAGKRPSVATIEIARNDQAVTVYIAGDSTVTDQTRGEFRGWGQMLPRFFKPGGVAISNHAESGEATTSFIGAKRLEKILNTLKKGDYLFVQFGHNDQNQKRTITAYKDALKRYIAEARKREAIPVLLTPMNRRNFGEGGKVRNSLGDYPEAVREVARDEKVMLIDLHAMSKEFYEALGEAKSKSAFVDNTHTNEYGGYQFARYIAETIQKSDIPLAKHVIDDLPAKNFTGK
jgi:lysophospholipase L1-like esterase